MDFNSKFYKYSAVFYAMNRVGQIDIILYFVPIHRNIILEFSYTAFFII